MAATNSADTRGGATGTARHLHESSAGFPTGGGVKLCCVCGADVAGHKRYKDHDGRYWCEDCKLAGREPGDGFPCPQCHVPTQPADLVTEPDGHTRLCKDCHHKREMAAKREKARLAAAAAAEAEAQRKRKMMTLAAAVAGAVAVLAGAIYIVL